MLVFEKLASVARDLVTRASDTAFGASSVRIFISNSSGALFSVAQQPYTSGSTNVSFSTLEPGEVGLLSVQGKGQIGFALEFKIESESVLVGVSNSSLRNAKLVFSFGALGRPAKQFYDNMPAEMMGCDGSRFVSEGEKYAVYVSRVTQSPHIVAHVLIGPKAEIVQFSEPGATREVTSRSCLAPGLLESLPMLEFVESKVEEGNSKDLGKALFLLELSSVLDALDSLLPRDRAFALDLLVAAFISPGSLGLTYKNLKSELQRWHDQQKLSFGEHPAAGALPLPPTASVAAPPTSMPLPQYAKYREREAASKENPAALEGHSDVALLVLKSAALECAMTMRSQLKRFENPGSTFEPFLESSFSFSPKKRASVDSILDTNCAFIADHLASEGEGGPMVAALSLDKESQVVAAAQQCIHDSASFALRRRQVLAKFEESLDSDARVALRHYQQWAPATKHCFSPGPDDAGGVKHESWAPELLGALDDGRLTKPELLLKSLGKGSPKYKVMSTNSKSGEFFFFSADRKFIIKTVSKDEAMLLYRMLPAYQAHIKATPRSFCVRFPGLHRVEIPGLGEHYFTVMASVFDSTHKVHETFDVKGSTLNRKAKEGESCGKDEDWVDRGHRLKLPGPVRREVREVHEQDAEFLAGFGVMDYSLLIGIHRCEPTGDAEGGAEDGAEDCGSGSPARRALGRGGGWREPSGLWAEGGQDLYFVGLIDFLIAFGLKKQAEHVLRSAQGHSADASCVDPKAYAERQVQFVLDSVLSKPELSTGSRTPRCPYGDHCIRQNPQHKEECCHPGQPGWEADEEDQSASGSAGTLRITFIKARDLKNADMAPGDLSDPYATAGLGLQRCSTHTVDNNLDPEWNCVVRLAVDRAHLGQELELSVWDEDHNRSLQGSDDFLGRLGLPVARLVRGGSLLVREKLQGVSKGELHVRIEFIPLAAGNGSPGR